ncbi:hypothetical protein L2737_02100 [Shewanella electrodiphila]|uniref:Lipoprotein n=1 Tax=Shewanella electrodiphila TaxID=934143 RepID=A0ABT0KK64_9GAMM|nr:hypothetical protein [Shewanella electrodiphila]MCL1044124.1 hypothetical protein [Shewanella electrodiphila]
MKVTLIVFLLITSLGACSSSPPRVEASRSMIKYDQVLESAKLVPETLWTALELKEEHEVISYNGKAISLGELYFSALGLQCRKIYISKIANIKADKFERISCKANTGEAWYLMSNVIDNNNKIELGN